MSLLVEGLKGRADRHRFAVVDRLGRLVGLESPSGDVELLDVLRDDLAERWRSLGLAVEVVGGPAGDHLVAKLAAGSGRPQGSTTGQPGHLLVVAHYDTVWPRGETGRRPFNCVGRQATGPGAFDMKGGIVAVELAVELLTEMGIGPAQDLRIVCVADEEMSSPNGRLPIMAEAQGAGAVIGLESPHPDGSLKSARRGVARVRLTVTGREAHAAINASSGVSAIDELVDQLLALRAGLPITAGDGALNIGTIQGGSRANVVAGEAHAEIGLRFSLPETEEAILDILGALKPRRAGATLNVEVLSHRPAWSDTTGASRANTAIVDHVLDLAAALGQPVGAKPAGGAGDTNLTGAAGIPTVDGLGPRGRGAHARNEMVDVDSMLHRAELLAALIASPLPAVRR